MLYIRIVSPFPEMEQFIQATVQRYGAQTGEPPGAGTSGVSASAQAAPGPRARAGTGSSCAPWRDPSARRWRG